MCVLKGPPIQVWLLNTSAAPEELKPQELFGFGLGTFTDKAVSAARLGSATSIPWLLEADYKLLVHVIDGAKVLRCFAQIAAWTTKNLGVTELSVTDHNVTNKQQD